MRKMFTYPPLMLVLLLIAGIVIGEKCTYFFKDVFRSLIVCCSLLFVVVFFTRNQSISRYFESLIFASISVILGMLSFNLTDIRISNDYFGKLISKQESVVLSLEIRETLKSNPTFDRYVAEVFQVQNKNSKGKVIVNVKRDSIKQVRIGSKFITNAPLNKISNPKNPHEFNYAKYLEKQQIFHQLYVGSGDLAVLKRTSGSFLVKLEYFREQLIQKIANRGIKNNELGVMSALLLGERDYLSAELRTSYIDAGAIHILAISGLHIGILFLLFSFLLKPLHRLPSGKIIAQILIIGCMWLFAMLAGLSASVVRAVTMFSFISIGMFLNRRNSVYHSLIASAFVLLVVHPRFLFEVGFQLSYTAVFFIVWLQPKLEKLWNPRFKIVQYFWQLITVSTAAQLGVLPLSLLYFHQFPSLFFISNLFIIPILGILLGCGLFVLLFVEFHVEADVFIEFYVEVIGLLNDFIVFIASYESFVMRHVFWSMGLAIAAYFVLLTFFKYVELRTRFRFGLTILSIFSFYGVLFYESINQQQQAELVVFHRSRTTLIGQLTGYKLKVFGNSKENVPVFMGNYISAKGIKEELYEPKLPHLIWANYQKIILIDSLGLYHYTSIENPIVLLRDSPKINLDRMVQKLGPSLIIADGSNYRSYVQKWKGSALKTKTPFHDTSQKGAYIFK